MGTNSKPNDEAWIEKAIQSCTAAEKELILSRLKEARRDELEQLLNVPGQSHSDIYYAGVKRLASLTQPTNKETSK